MHLNLVWILYLTLLSRTVARTPHPCYYDVDKLASDSVIPCYPSTFSSHYSCCHVGDKCLEENACHNVELGVTYLYGCTDPSFKDSHCPQKCKLDTDKSHWVGLVFCNGTNELPSDEWVCHHPDNCAGIEECDEKVWDEDIEIWRGAGCDNLKHDEEYVAFDWGSTLSDIAALPSSSRLASYWSANSDRTNPSAGTLTLIPPMVRTTSESESTVTASPGYSASTTPSSTLRHISTTITTDSTPATSTTSPSPTTPVPARGKTATIGLGVGIGVGVPVLLGLAGLTCFYIRRQRKNSQAALVIPSVDYPPEKGAVTDIYAHNVGTPGPGYAHKAELDGTPIVETCGSPTPSELPGSIVSDTPCQSPFVSPEIVQREFERKERMSARVEGEGEGPGAQELPG